MPWRIPYAPPPIAKAKASAPTSAPAQHHARAPSQGADPLSAQEDRTHEIESLVETLSKKLAHLESIASGQTPLSKSAPHTREVKAAKADLVYLWDPVGPECQGPILLLQKTNTAFKERKFEMDDQKRHPNRTDAENTRYNYNNTLPTLIDKQDDFGVSESHSILRYLAEKFFPDSHWYPANLKTRSKINNYLDWHVATIRTTFVVSGLAMIPAFSEPKQDAYSTLLRDALYGSSNPIWKDRADNGLLEQLKVINDRWLKSSRYLAGDEVSIADLSLFGDCGYILHLFNVDFKKFPKVHAWYNQMDKEFGKLPARKNYIENMIRFGEAFKPFLTAAGSLKSGAPSSSSSSSSQSSTPAFTSPSRPQKEAKQPEILGDHGDDTDHGVRLVEKKGKEQQQELGQDKEYFETAVWRSEISAEPLADPE